MRWTHCMEKSNGCPVRSRESPRHTCDSMSRERAASPPGWLPFRRGQSCRSGISAVAVEVIVNNAG